MIRAKISDELIHETNSILLHADDLRNLNDRCDAFEGLSNNLG